MSCICHNPLVPEGCFISKVEADVITWSPIKMVTAQDYINEMVMRQAMQEYKDWKREYLPLTNPEE